MTVLTLDFGTSATKAALWSGAELIELARVPIVTRHPAPGHAEQNPADWWQSVVEAGAALRAATPRAYGQVRAVGCSTARETFACFDQQLRPLSPGILWSDTRATDQVATLGNPRDFRALTGVIATGGCCAAKLAWVRAHQPDLFRRATWVLGPRDVVLARLTGRAQTEPTVASRTGYYALDGTFLGDDSLAARLPAVVPSLEPTPIAHPDLLGLPADVVAVLGAGDRTCEAIAVGADPVAPMVSWGTTANVSAPHPGPSGSLPMTAQVSRALAGGYLVEAGLSLAGAALDWLATITTRPRDELLRAADEVNPGANGLLAFAWLEGARAPWWRPAARGAFSGITPGHGPAELARALLEGVALDAARSVELVAPRAETLMVAGAGAQNQLWCSILAAVTGRSVTRRRLSDAASAGARVLVACADEPSVTIDDLNPVVGVETPRPELVDAYRPVRAASDALAAALLTQGS